MARLPISGATTEKPLPASPALAASILAFNASKLVWEEIAIIASVNSLILDTDFASSIVFSVFLQTINKYSFFFDYMTLSRALFAILTAQLSYELLCKFVTMIS